MSDEPGQPRINRGKRSDGCTRSSAPLVDVHRPASLGSTIAYMKYTIGVGAEGAAVVSRSSRLASSIGAPLAECVAQWVASKEMPSSGPEMTSMPSRNPPATRRRRARCRLLEARHDFRVFNAWLGICGPRSGASRRPNDEERQRSSSRPRRTCVWSHGGRRFQERAVDGVRKRKLRFSRRP